MIKKAKMKELPNDIESLQKLVLQLLERVEKLEAENADLRRQLGMNSQNSHKPPSSDGLKKAKKKRVLLMRFLSFPSADNTADSEE